MNLIKRISGSIFWYFLQGTNMKGSFESLYLCREHTKVFEAINRKVFGDLYVGDIIDPCGLSTLEDLNCLYEHSGLKPNGNSGQKIIDLACGRGGAGLWLGSKTGSELFGVDLSENAIQDARNRIEKFGMSGRARFESADIRTIPAETDEYDLAMCIDALFMIPDKHSVLREIHRVLKPGGRFACFTWEVKRICSVHDYRPLLKNAQFNVEYYEEVPGWRDRQRMLHEEVLKHRQELIEEMGKKAASFWINGAKYELKYLDLMRRVFFTVRK